MNTSYGMGLRWNVPKPAFSPALGSCQWVAFGVSCMGNLRCKQSAVLLRQNLFDVLKQVGRSVGDSVDGLQHLRAVDRAHVDLESLRFVEILRVLVHGEEGGFQRLGAIGREAGRSRKRT